MTEIVFFLFSFFATVFILAYCLYRLNAPCHHYFDSSDINEEDEMPHCMKCGKSFNEVYREINKQNK